MVDPTIEAAFDAAFRIAGYALLSCGIALTAAAVYRWYGRAEIPEGVAILLGLGSVALWLNTTATLAGAVGGNTALLEPVTALFTIGAFGTGGIAADLGRRVGDRLGRDAAALTGGVTGPRDAEMTTLVRSGGRVLRVVLPDEIEDVDGYDPVAVEKKHELAGTTFLFPRRLTVAELRDRLTARLQDDYGVGRVEVELEPDGTIERLALGSRPAGIGRTLPPGTVAVAIRADPPFAASPGDAVEVWRSPSASGRAGSDAERSVPDTGHTGSERSTPAPGRSSPDPERVTAAELRAAVGDVVTLVVEERAAERLDDGSDYRLVTLPRSEDDDRELLSAIRGARAAAGVVDVEPGSDAAGATVADLDVTVVALETGDGLEGLPQPGRTIAPGDVAYVVGPPDRLRQLGASVVREAETTS